MSGEIEIRRVATLEEYRACVALQRETWGEDFTEVVPFAILMVSQRIGGVTGGAFTPAGELIGFVFGMTGLEDGHPVHWSDMLAVKEAYRGRGLGRDLKLYQRSELLDIGVRRVYWTYDPLVARNAHLNLNRLGAQPVEYVVNKYGFDTASALHSGLGTDRFVLAWDIASKDVESIIAEGRRFDPQAYADTPVVNTELDENGAPRPVEKEFMHRETVLVEAPGDIFEVKARAPEEAMRWRESTRRAFQVYMGRGYVVEGVFKSAGGRWFYVVREEG